MKKVNKILCTGVLALASIGASVGLVGCTQEDIKNGMNQAINTTNAIAVEYSVDMARACLIDAAIKSSNAKNIKTESVATTSQFGIIYKVEKTTTLEKTNDKFLTTFYINSETTNPITEEKTYEFETVVTCINKKYYEFDLKDKDYKETDNVREIAPIRTILEQVLQEEAQENFKIVSAKYINNELVVVCNNITFTINQDGYISSIAMSYSYGSTGHGSLNGVVYIGTATFTYDDVTFPVAIPTDFTGYTIKE